MQTGVLVAEKPLLFLGTVFIATKNRSYGKSMEAGTQRIDYALFYDDSTESDYIQN